jgi:hypothetical protein
MMKVCSTLYCTNIFRGTAVSIVHFISIFLSETLLQMSQHMPEMKRTVSECVVAKIIDNFQQIAPQEVFMEFH